MHTRGDHRNLSRLFGIWHLNNIVEVQTNLENETVDTYSNRCTRYFVKLFSPY